MNAHTIFKWISIGGHAFLSSMALAAPSGTTIFNVTYRHPTCDIVVQPTYDLGNLLKDSGALVHPAPLLIGIKCTTVGFSSSLTASTASPMLPGSANQNILLTNNKTIMYLLDKTSGSDVAVTFDGATKFCKTSQSSLNRTCNLKVVTNVLGGSTTGLISIPVTFTVAFH